MYMYQGRKRMKKQDKKILKKDYCFAVILILLLSTVLTGCRIETVKQHNERLSIEAEERSIALAELESKEETTRKSIYKDTTVEETSTEMLVDKVTMDSENQAGEESGEDSSATISQEQRTELVDNPAGNGSTQINQTNNSQIQSSQAQSQSSQGQTTENNTLETTTKKPQPTTTEKVTEINYNVVNVTITCGNVIGNENLSTTASIPADGIFFQGKIAIKKGQTVYDALKATCSDNNISYGNSGDTQSVYIYQIAGLSEKECGKYSGWKFKVNGMVPNISCGEYELQDGDELIWYYAEHYMD